MLDKQQVICFKAVNVRPFFQFWATKEDDVLMFCDEWNKNTSMREKHSRLFAQQAAITANWNYKTRYLESHHCSTTTTNLTKLVFFTLTDLFQCKEYSFLDVLELHLSFFQTNFCFLHNFLLFGIDFGILYLKKCL